MTPKDITYYGKNPSYHHPFYNQNVKFAYDIRKHLNGEYPKELIDEARPGESDTVKAYRAKIYKPKTKRAVTKVLNALQKIRKSQDWKIDYPSETNPKIAEGETLKDYMELNFGKYTSFTNYTFSVALRYIAYDANAITLWLPSNINKEDNEYYKPVPIIFTSEQIIDYLFDTDGNMTIVLLSKEKVKLSNSQPGSVYYTVDSTTIQKFEQVNSDQVFTEAWEFEHNLGFLPIVTMEGQEYESANHLCSYTARMYPMIPDLDEAAREYSDVQASVVQHLHPLLWIMNNQECIKCKGSGSIPVQNEAPITCPSCKGSGRPPFNPYEFFSVKPSQAGEAQVPVPPAGEIPKQLGIVELQDKRVRDHIHDSFSSIGMEILDAVPLNQSGVAKEIDRSEPDAFINSFAEDLVRYMDDGYYIVNEYRYKGIITDEKKREAQLPFIAVPVKYDLITEGMIMQQINNLVASKADPAFIRASTVDLINKKYDNDDEEKERLLMKIELDPYAGQSEEMLAIKLMNGGIPNKAKYILHSGISEYVDRLIEDQGDKLKDMPKKEKLKILLGYAREDMAAMTTGETKLLTPTTEV